MIEPEVTAVQGRRYLALLLDSSLVAATGLGVAYQQSTAFTVVGRDNADAPLVDPAEFERMEELLDFELFGQSEIFGTSLVRAQEIGDSVRVFGSDSYLWGFAAAAVAAIVVFFAIPALIQRTLGMLPFGLAIRNLDGGKAGVGAHVKRSLAGILDMAPWVIPGLLGFLVAGLSPRHQRIGDRLAGTAVVDRKLANFHTSDGQASSMAFDSASDDEVDSDAKAAEATIDPSPAAGRLESDLANTPVPVDEAAADVAVDHPEPDAPAIATPPASDTTPPFIPDPEPAHIEPALTESAQTEPALTEPALTEPAPSEQLPAADEPAPMASPEPALAFDGAPLPPPPVHRKPTTTAGNIDLDQPLVDTEADRSAAEPLAALRVPSATNPASAEPPPSSDPAIEHAQLADQAETAAEAWAATRVEPAPVWQPAPFDPAPVEAPDPHDGRTLDDVVPSEPTVGELISAEPAVAEAAADAEPAAASRYGNQAATREGGTAKAPVWSDKWRAWMYWDPAKKCWLRHDTKTNSWVAVES